VNNELKMVVAYSRNHPGIYLEDSDKSVCLIQRHYMKAYGGSGNTASASSGVGEIRFVLSWARQNGLVSITGPGHRNLCVKMETDPVSETTCFQELNTTVVHNKNRVEYHRSMKIRNEPTCSNTTCRFCFGCLSNTWESQVS
jgi:hypothetical protein